MLALATFWGKKAINIAVFIIFGVSPVDVLSSSLAAAIIKESVLRTDWCRQQTLPGKIPSIADSCILVLHLISHISIKHETMRYVWVESPNSVQIRLLGDCRYEAGLHWKVESSPG